VCPAPLALGIHASHCLLNEVHFVVAIHQDDGVRPTAIGMIFDVNIQGTQSLAPIGRTPLQFGIRPEFVLVPEQLHQVGGKGLHTGSTVLLHYRLELLLAVTHLLKGCVWQAVAKSVALAIPELLQRGRHIAQQLHAGGQG